jgi:pSer/pThr/pTyr-binding forkhead associated (FHA) protein
LFDLDFARVGDISESSSSSAVVDFPRGTGHIAYRKLVVAGGRVKGALLIGEREARVRTIGRGLKRLIDTGADVSAVSARLLEPSFDVAGFLETQKLLAPPQAPRAATRAVPAAKLRGTQALSLGTVALAGPSALQGPGTALLPSRTSLIPSSGPRGATRMLSIGLRAEGAPAPPAARAGEPPLDARIELGGRALPITGKLCSIGSAPDATIRLEDRGAAYLHAQIERHGAGLYLRDAGTQNGTWVNGVPLAGAHALHDGDRIVIGQSELIFRSSVLGKSETSLLPVIAVPRLELRSGPSLGLCFVLSGESCSIGSGPAAQLQVFEPSVAPLHARVRNAHGLHYLSDLGSPSGSYARGARLPPGQELVLGEGEVFQVGAVAVAYTRAPTADRLAAFRPMARLIVVSGAGAGQSAAFAERALVGGAPGLELRLPGLGPHELELIQHQGSFFARDLSGGRTFKSGVPLGHEWVPLRGGEMLLVSSGALLRFEDA